MTPFSLSRHWVAFEKIERKRNLRLRLVNFITKGDHMSFSINSKHMKNFIESLPFDFNLFFKLQACVLKLHIMWKMKYTFWLQKGVELENEYHFWNLWMLIFWQCYDFLSHEINFEGSSARNNRNTFFFSILWKKNKKQEYTVFGYKKWSKFKSNITFENFGR